MANEEDYEEDYVDSDFDIDEEEEPADQNENEDDEENGRKKVRRTGGVVTKAYKDPLGKKSETLQPKKKLAVAADADDASENRNSSSASQPTVENKSFRSSTARKREELMQRQQEREANRQKTKTKASIEQSELRRLTQEELLAEAKITEKINLASLDAYQKLESEKKKKTQTKLTIKGPVVRYHSVVMPLIENDDEMTSEETANPPTVKKQSRNFIIFSDEQTLHSVFPNSQQKQKPPDVSKKLCAVTGQPAKYFDPITQKPYANLYAFKVLRELHASKKD